jgi:hypothetical protein
MKNLHIQLYNIFKYALSIKQINFFCFCLTMRLFVFHIRKVSDSEQSRHL